MPVRVATSLADILDALAAQLAAGLSLASHLVFATDRDDDEILATAPPNDFFISIHPEDFVFDMGLAAGAGREAIGTDGTLRICLWSSLNVDRAGRGEEWLKNATRGVLVKWRDVVSNLQIFDPVDGSGFGILEEPMRCVRWSVRRPKATKGLPRLFGKLESVWEVKFLQPVDTPAVVGVGTWIGSWL